MTLKRDCNLRRRRKTQRPITRAEFENALKALNEREEMVNDLRRELHATCRDLGEGVRRDLQTQFTRIAQLQQEIDELKRKNSG